MEYSLFISIAFFILAALISIIIQQRSNRDHLMCFAWVSSYNEGKLYFSTAKCIKFNASLLIWNNGHGCLLSKDIKEPIKIIFNNRISKINIHNVIQGDRRNGSLKGKVVKYYLDKRKNSLYIMLDSDFINPFEGVRIDITFMMKTYKRYKNKLIQYLMFPNHLFFERKKKIQRLLKIEGVFIGKNCEFNEIYAHFNFFSLREKLLSYYLLLLIIYAVLYMLVEVGLGLFKYSALGITIYFCFIFAFFYYFFFTVVKIINIKLWLPKVLKKRLLK